VWAAGLSAIVCCTSLLSGTQCPQGCVCCPLAVFGDSCVTRCSCPTPALTCLRVLSVTGHHQQEQAECMSRDRLSVMAGMSCVLRGVVACSALAHLCSQDALQTWTLSPASVCCCDHIACVTCCVYANACLAQTVLDTSSGCTVLSRCAAVCT
jgi:hypothetical protein